MDSWQAGEPFPSHFIVHASSTLAVSYSGTLLALQPVATLGHGTESAPASLQLAHPLEAAPSTSDSEYLPNESICEGAASLASPARLSLSTHKDRPPFKLIALSNVPCRAAALTSHAESSLFSRRNSVRQVKAVARQAVSQFGEFLRKGADSLLASVVSGSGGRAPQDEAVGLEHVVFADGDVSLSETRSRSKRRSNSVASASAASAVSPELPSLPEVPRGSISPIPMHAEGLDTPALSHGVTDAVYYFEVAVQHMESTSHSPDPLGVCIGFMPASTPALVRAIVFCIFGFIAFTVVFCGYPMWDNSTCLC